MTYDPKKPEFLVLDVETTGLDPTCCLVLEIGCLALNRDLEEIGCYTALIKPGLLVVGGPEGNAEPEALALHDRTGLLDELIRPDGRARPLDVVALEVADWLRSVGFDTSRVGGIRLVGNNPAFDRAFVKRSFPTLDRCSHYRMIDVSTLRTVVALCRGQDEKVVKASALGSTPEGDHRSLEDCRSCAAELRAYAAVVAEGCE